MSLREEWDKLRDDLERLARDATRLTTVTRLEQQGQERGRVTTAVQLDGDTDTQASGQAAQLAGCHRAAIQFTSELAHARLRALTRVAGVLLP